MSHSPDEIVAKLIDGWCERRALRLLRGTLGAWPHNGLTDGVAMLLTALQSIRNDGDLLEAEKRQLNQAIEGYRRSLDSR